MPYKSEKLIKLEGTNLDRRRKLDDFQKAEIKVIRAHDGTSYNQIAKMYGVSKRLIILICNPIMGSIMKEQYRERRKDGRYYNRKKHTSSVKSMRRYKQEIYKQLTNK